VGSCCHLKICCKWHGVRIMPKPNHPQLWLHPKSMTAPLNMHAACVCSHHPSQRPHMVHFSTAQPGQPECSQNNNTPTAHNCTDHSSLYSIHHHILANLCNARTNKSLQQLHTPYPSVANGSSRCFFDISNKIAKNLKIFGEIDLIKYYHLIFLS
jgi:hypothetical protein